MPLERLTASDLAGLQGKGQANPEYVRFLSTLKVGEGGRGTTAGENASRATIKNRLARAATEAGVTITFHRSPADQVVFAVVDSSTTPSRGRRPRSSAPPATSASG